MAASVGGGGDYEINHFNTGLGDRGFCRRGQKAGRRRLIHRAASKRRRCEPPLSPLSSSLETLGPQAPRRPYQ